MTKKKEPTPNLDAAIAAANHNGVEFPFKCDRHPDRNASASVNLEKGVWYCYSCGAKGRTTSGDVLTAVMNRYLKMMKEPGLGEARKPYPQAWLSMFDAYRTSPYWADRVGDATARKYRCGTHPYTALPTYPVHDAAGSVAGVVERNEVNPKYIYPSGIHISKTMFGIHLVPERVRQVIVVEGASGVMEIDRYNEDPETVILGCYGAGMHKPQVELVNGLQPKEVLLAFDNDKAGTRANNINYELDAPTYLYQWPDYANDAGDLSKQHIQELISE